MDYMAPKDLTLKHLFINSILKHVEKIEGMVADLSELKTHAIDKDLEKKLYWSLLTIYLDIKLVNSLDHTILDKARKETGIDFKELEDDLYSKDRPHLNDELLRAIRNCKKLRQVFIDYQTP